MRSVPANSLAFFAGLGALAVVAHAAGPVEEVSSDRLMETIAALPTKRSGDGSDEHRRGLAEARDVLVERIEALGLEPTLQPVEWSPPAEPDNPDPFVPDWHNIIIDLPGRDLASEVLIITAHYDAVPESPGADDDGTGVAAIVELARVLRDEPTRRSIRLILFTLEEVWLVGSQQYVRQFREEGLDTGEETVVGMISLDGLGYFSDEPGSQRSPIPPQPGIFEPPTVGDFILITGVSQHKSFSQRLEAEMKRAVPELKVFTVDSFPMALAPRDLFRSDHAPFLLNGLPGVMMTDTANFRSPHYHKATDTIDTIDVDRYTLVVKALAGAALAIAEPFPPNDAPAADESDSTDDAGGRR